MSIVVAPILLAIVAERVLVRQAYGGSECLQNEMVISFPAIRFDRKNALN